LDDSVTLVTLTTTRMPEELDASWPEVGKFTEKYLLFVTV
jgi:hypothetical protein